MGIILMLVLFFPAGLYLMWRYASWRIYIKAFITLIAFVSVVIYSADHSSAPSPDRVTIAVQPTHQVVTPTPIPTPTSKPLTVEQRIVKLVKDNGGSDTLYFADQKTVQTTVVLGEQWSSGTMKDSVKIKCYDVQKALWTNHFELDSVTVFVKGSVVDRYGKQSVEQVGFCTLKNPTASRFVWDNLTWKSAWDVYDTMGLAPFLQNA